MTVRRSSFFLVLLPALALAGCGSGGVRPSEKAFFPEPYPKVSGQAWVLPGHAGAPAGHRSASLAGQALVPPPEGTEVTLTAVDAKGVQLAGSSTVHVNTDGAGKFEFFDLPDKCAPTDPEGKGCVSGASPNLLLAIGEGHDQLRSFVTFQADQTIDPLSEAMVAAIIDGDLDLSHFGPTGLPPLLKSAQEETRTFPVESGAGLELLVRELRLHSGALQTATGYPKVQRVDFNPGLFPKNQAAVSRLEALGVQTADQCLWQIPGVRFVKSLTDTAETDPAGKCVVYIQLTLAQDLEASVYTSRPLGTAKSYPFTIRVSP